MIKFDTRCLIFIVKRIRKQKEFDNLRKFGKKYKNGNLDLVVAKPDKYSSLDENDFGLAVITSKRIGNAVERNQVRRWIKEWFRQTNFQIKPNLNYLVITKTGIVAAGREKIIKELKNVLKKSE